MTNYGYSTPYQGATGGLLPSGSMEALTAPGRNIGRGIEQFGAGVSQMIQRYQQTKAEKELASGELEGLIAQYIPQAKDLPSGETGGVDMGFLGKIVGEKNVKKFVEGKASTADILAMTHSLKTAQSEKDKALAREAQTLQIDQYRRQQMKDIEELNRAQAIPKAINFALQNQNQPAPENLGKVGDTTVGVEPIPYEQARQDLARYMAATNAPPESFNALDQILQIAGKRQPVQVGVQQLPGNLGTVVTAGGKTEIVKPDPSVAARVIPGYSGIVPTEKEAIEFRQLQADAADASGLADELLQLSKVPFSTVDPAMRTRGQSLAQQLVGKMRLAVLGPGTINENERKILENLAANPATIFSLDVNTKSALNTLKQTLSKSVESKAKSLGLQGSGGSSTSGQPQLPRVIFNPALAK